MENITLLSSFDSLALRGVLCLPAEKPVALVQLVHGMAEHKERYFPFMEYLASKGIASAIFDTRGHGESIADESELGYVGGGVPAVLADLVTINQGLRERFPGLPYTLMGHSMGSLAVRLYAQRYDHTVDRLIVCGSPSANPAASAGVLLAEAIALFKGEKHPSPFLDKMAFGSFGPEFCWLSSDEVQVQRYRDDPLCGFLFTAQGFATLFRMMRDVYRPAGWDMRNRTMPVLFVAGEKDPCIGSVKKFNGAVKFMRDMGYRDVRSILYPNMRHEILNEHGKEQVYEDLAAFLLS